MCTGRHYVQRQQSNGYMYIYIYRCRCKYVHMQYVQRQKIICKYRYMFRCKYVHRHHVQRQKAICIYSYVQMQICAQALCAETKSSMYIYVQMQICAQALCAEAKSNMYIYICADANMCTGILCRGKKHYVFVGLQRNTGISIVWYDG